MQFKSKQTLIEESNVSKEKVEKMLYYSQTQLVSMEKNLNIDVMKENLGHINLERNKEKNVH